VAQETAAAPPQTRLVRLDPGSLLPYLATCRQISRRVTLRLLSQGRGNSTSRYLGASACKHDRNSWCGGLVSQPTFPIASAMSFPSITYVQPPPGLGRFPSFSLTRVLILRLLNRAWQTLWKPVPDLISILGVDVPEPPDVSLAGIRADAATLNWTRPPHNRPVQKFLIQVNGVNG
jgi:hypothetical protein